MSRPEYDLLIKNVRVVRPHGNAVHDADIAITDGRIANVAPGLAVERAKEVWDGRGRLAFPGVVDAHMHSGIYSPLAEDAVTESKAAAIGGVTDAGKSTIELSITEDSKFTWKATEADKVVAELDGDLVAAGDAISLDTSDKGSMAGSVVSGGADQWTFIPPGAPAEAGLKFNRKK